MTEAKASSLDLRLLELLVCPQIRTPGSLRYDTKTQELISDQAGLAYPIRDGIPIMLVSEARRLTAEQAADQSEIDQ